MISEFRELDDRQHTSFPVSSITVECLEVGIDEAAPLCLYPIDRAFF